MPNNYILIQYQNKLVSIPKLCLFSLSKAAVVEDPQDGSYPIKPNYDAPTCVTDFN